MIEYVEGRMKACPQLLGFLWRRHCWHRFVESLQFGRCQVKRPVLARRCCLCDAKRFVVVID